MMSGMNRAWSAQCRYDGKRQFYLGTVVLDAAAKQHEIDDAVKALWSEISPHDIPDFVAVPGAVFFKPGHPDNTQLPGGNLAVAG